mmetsp:Transcript_32089/g.90995  ORF Transcript_32089/g.90995 Transcript_32089/m.90995 type:complete len:340 (+) Transcript_32089:139-1158(+)
MSSVVVFPRTEPRGVHLVIGDFAAVPTKKGNTEVEEAKKVDFGEVISTASKKAFRGGVAGMAAGVVQVVSFMWLRTTMNYQYAQGGNLPSALKTLYKEGAAGSTGIKAVAKGVGRFYRGLPYAIVQAPISRFGDTAANTGILAVADAYYPGVAVGIKTAFASVGGASWRIFIMPVDCYKTTLQVKGADAVKQLNKKVADKGIGVLYSGAAANFAANWVGNYPWFATFNTLQVMVPEAEGKMKLLRNAGIGICSAAVSDCVSNSLRVIKTVKQTNPDPNMTYAGAVKSVVQQGGIGALFGRGLQTRLITNILQSMVFSVAWKAIEEELNKKDVQEAKKKA